MEVKPDKKTLPLGKELVVFDTYKVEGYVGYFCHETCAFIYDGEIPAMDVFSWKYLNKSKIENIVFESVNHGDYPDYSDAYIISADYDGEQLPEAALERLNTYSSFVHEKLLDQLV